MWQKTEHGSLPPSYELLCLAFGRGRYRVTLLSPL